jgi:hypothetical protein
MKSSIIEATDRRNFLLASLGSVFAWSRFGAIGFGSGELIAATQKPGRLLKPALSPEAFTEHLASPEKLKGIKFDLVHFVDTHFDLSPGQLENFKRVPKEDMKNLVQALEKAEKLKVKVTMRTQMSRMSCGDGLGFRLKTSFDAKGLTILSYR